MSGYMVFRFTSTTGQVGINQLIKCAIGLQHMCMYDVALAACVHSRFDLVVHVHMLPAEMLGV